MRSYLVENFWKLETIWKITRTPLSVRYIFLVHKSTILHLLLHSCRPTTWVHFVANEFLVASEIQWKIIDYPSFICTPLDNDSHKNIIRIIQIYYLLQSHLELQNNERNKKMSNYQFPQVRGHVKLQRLLTGTTYIFQTSFRPRRIVIRIRDTITKASGGKDISILGL